MAGGRGEEEEKRADWTDRAAPSTDKTEGIGRDSRAGRRLEERANSSRRRAGAGDMAGRRGETDARAGQRGETRRWQWQGQGQTRQETSWQGRVGGAG